MAIAAGSRADQSTDYYSSFRFLIYDDQGYIQTGSNLVAGFSNCSVPEQNIDHLEYSEGTWTYSKMYPGRSTFTSITLSRGVVKNYTKFSDWITRAAEGQDYRSNVTIVNYHRSDLKNKSSSSEFLATHPTQSRKIVCYNCVPIRFRPGHDFDSLNSDITVQEVEFQPEYFKVFQVDPGSTA